MKILPRCVFPLLIAVLPVACSTNSQVADFAKNDLFYTDVPFQTKAPGDRVVFVAPLADARDGAQLPQAERGFPITYVGDDFWERPVAEMMGEVLQRQLASSGLFAAVEDHAVPNGLVIKPTLVSFLGGATEAISGASSFADVGVRVQVLGPAAGDGKRVLLLDRVYGNRQVSPNEINPVSPYRLVGRAMQLAMTKLLTGLDGSNVARSDVPLDAVPAEASARAR